MNKEKNNNVDATIEKSKQTVSILEKKNNLVKQIQEVEKQHQMLGNQIIFLKGKLTMLNEMIEGDE